MKTLPLSFSISGTKLMLPFKAVCTVTNKEFGGQVIIEYYPVKKTLEYVDAEKRIVALCRKKLMAEELAHLTFQDAWKSLKPKYLKVTIDVHYSKAHQPAQVWVEKWNK